MGSHVIVKKATSKAVLETSNKKLIAAINLDKYEVVPVLSYLQNLNKQIIEAQTSKAYPPA
jgi:hypothetical protein